MSRAEDIVMEVRRSLPHGTSDWDAWVVGQLDSALALMAVDREFMVCALAYCKHHIEPSGTTHHGDVWTKLERAYMERRSRLAAQSHAPGKEK